VQCKQCNNNNNNKCKITESISAEKYITCREVHKTITVYNEKEEYDWIYSWNYTGDWYLLRAKFMND